MVLTRYQLLNRYPKGRGGKCREGLKTPLFTVVWEVAGQAAVHSAGLPEALEASGVKEQGASGPFAGPQVVKRV